MQGMLYGKEDEGRIWPHKSSELFRKPVEESGSEINRYLVSSIFLEANCLMRMPSEFGELIRIGGSSTYFRKRITHEKRRSETSHLKLETPVPSYTLTRKLCCNHT